MDPAGTDRFCPRCGGRLASRFLPQEGHERAVCGSCGFVLYRHSKPCASALVVRDGQVLLVRRGVEPFKGWWDIPGGFLEAGEHPEDGTRREVLEETGLHIRLAGLLGIFMDVYGDEGSEHTLNIFYLAEPDGGTLRAASDAVELGWFGPHHLPDQVAFRCCREALETWRRGAGNAADEAKAD